MMTILPNWHPLFVHFTVALYSAVVGFSLLAVLASRLTVFPLKWASDFETTARWCLWAVAIITLFTVIAGFIAYQTVMHDAPSHAAMKIHWHWAVPTAVVIWVLTLWSIWRYVHRQAFLSIAFFIGLLIGQTLLLTTAWHGAELVFRYGLGVLSLPTPPAELADSHLHSH